MMVSSLTGSFSRSAYSNVSPLINSIIVFDRFYEKWWATI